MHATLVSVLFKTSFHLSTCVPGVCTILNIIPSLHMRPRPRCLTIFKTSFHHSTCFPSVFTIFKTSFLHHHHCTMFKLIILNSHERWNDVLKIVKTLGKHVERWNDFLKIVKTLGKHVERWNDVLKIVRHWGSM